MRNKFVALMFCFSLVGFLSCASSKGRTEAYEAEAARIYDSWSVKKNSIDDALFGFFSANSLPERVAYLDVLKGRRFPEKAVELCEAFDGQPIVRKRVIKLLKANRLLPIRGRLAGEIQSCFKGTFFYNRFRDLFEIDPGFQIPMTIEVTIKPTHFIRNKTEYVASYKGPQKTIVAYSYTTVDADITIKLGELPAKKVAVHDELNGALRPCEIFGRIFTPDSMPDTPYAEVNNIVQDFLRARAKISSAFRRTDLGQLGSIRGLKTVPKRARDLRHA